MITNITGKDLFDAVNESNQYEVRRSISGYYRLFKDDELIHDDPACEDVYDIESAYNFFADFIVHHQ